MSFQSALNNPDVPLAAEALGFIAASRLQFLNTHTLNIVPYGGLGISVNGEFQLLPPSGLSMSDGNNLITAGGADSGAPPAASQVYFLYMSNSTAAVPSALVMCATAPATGSQQGPELPGGHSEYRFVGWAYWDGTFHDDNAFRATKSYYNRLSCDMFMGINYINDNAQTTFSPAAVANWAIMKAGNLVQFIHTGDDSAEFGIAVSKSAGVVACGVALALDTIPVVSQELPALAGANASCDYVIPLGGPINVLRNAAPYYHTDGVTAPTFIADGGRHGAAADIAATYIWGQVWH